MKKLNKKTMTTMLSMGVIISITYSIVAHASDIEIYSSTSPGKLTLFMMFDTSGSMGYGMGYSGNNRTSASSLFNDYGICAYNNYGSSYGLAKSVQTEAKTYNINNQNKKYNVSYCQISQKEYTNITNTWDPSTGNFVALGDTLRDRISNECVRIGTDYRCYDRLSRLKLAMVEALSGDKIADSTRIGLGQFSSPTNNNDFSHDSISGRVIYPAVELTQANREQLIEKIVGLSAYNGTPSAAAYAEAAAYLLGTNTYNINRSGYSYSDANIVPKIRNGNNGYVSPLAGIDTASECNGQGIYFLTDGFANGSNQSATQNLMQKSVGTLSGVGLSGGSNDAGWNEIGQFAINLRDKKYIKTAVVGFGSLFPNDSSYVKTLTNIKGKQSTYYDCSKLAEGDLKNTCNWGAKPQSDISDSQRNQISSSVGGYGNGGFYSAQSVDDVVDSIVKFIGDVTPDFSPIATGSPSIPVDSLNAIELRPHGYYATFIPKPQDTVTLWLGNLNKYNIYNGQLGVGNSSGFRRLIKEDGALDGSVEGLWAGGIKQQLSLGTASDKTSKRKVLTDRLLINNNGDEQSNRLQEVNLTTLFDADNTKAIFKNDSFKNYWLNILGYNVATNANITSINDLPLLENRQVGAIMHSSPILLTQEGKIVLSNGVVTTTNRQDYLLAGSTQGILHVINNDDGKEVFAFVPNKMFEKQKDGFLTEGNTLGGKDKLYYGIDGQWTAFTQYVRTSDGIYTVKKTKQVIENKDIESSGLQWVYGGLRMGGKNYYALDLSNINTPTLKFHIDPDQQKIYRAENTILSVPALKYMGQSWSKPTIGYVKFGGEKKLVMFVGGGYDEGYEKADYKQTNNIGSGVYMFDANTGALLWWTSANANAIQGAESSTFNADLKFSVVSQINALDRDSDGYIDNLYFGDLGGQAFRIDINNNAKDKENFGTRVTRIYNGNQSDGKSPRFYESPSFSVHDGINGLFGVVALSSGNRSLPLAGESGKNANGQVSAADGIFVIYDNDVGRADLYDSAFVATPITTDLSELTLYSGIPQYNSTKLYNRGWKYIYSPNNPGAIKSLNNLYAIDNMLYVNVFDRDGVGIGGKCGAGVKGDSYVYQFCLPTGKCNFYNSATKVPNSTKLGAGILGASIGQDYQNSGNAGLILPRTNNFNCTTNPNLPECQKFATKATLKQLRWYDVR